MSAAPKPQVDDTIYTVTQWKEELDPSYKWWQKVFYRWLYLPFNEFALRVVKIPKATEVVVKDNEYSFRWWEVEGHFGSADEADLACLTERYCYKEYPFGRLYTPQSGQIGNGPVFPRAKNPVRRIQPILQMVIKDRKQDDRERTTLAEALKQLNQVLDR